MQKTYLDRSFKASINSVDGHPLQLYSIFPHADVDQLAKQNPHCE